MSQKIIDIITLIINKMGNNFLTDNNIDEIKKSLKSHGFSDKEIGTAIDWLEKNILLLQKPVRKKTKTRHRVQTNIEKHIISPAAYAFLMQLVRTNEITETEMEITIDHIMMSGMSRVSEYEILEFLNQLGFGFEAKAKRKYTNYIDHTKQNIH